MKRLLTLLFCAGALTLHAAHKETPPLGVCHMQSLKWSSLSREIEILGEIKKANIRRIRLGVDPGDLELLKTRLAFCRKNDIEVLLLVPVSYGFEDYSNTSPQRRAGIPEKKLWSALRPSQMDLGVFDRRVRELLNLFKETGCYPHAIELFNESNSPGFNGDFPLQGNIRVFDGSVPAENPALQQITQGIENMAECHKILRRALDEILPDKKILCISAGLVPTISAEKASKHPDGPVSGMPAQNYLQIYKDCGALEMIDSVGVHFYPYVNRSNLGDPAGIQKAVAGYMKEPLQRIREVAGSAKPLYMTEWGFSKDKHSEEDRLELAIGFVRVCAAMDVNWTGLMFFDFVKNTEHRIFENGILLPTGKIFATGLQLK